MNKKFRQLYIFDICITTLWFLAIPILILGLVYHFLKLDNTGLDTILLISFGGVAGFTLVLTYILAICMLVYRKLDGISKQDQSHLLTMGIVMFFFTFLVCIAAFAILQKLSNNISSIFNDYDIPNDGKTKFYSKSTSTVTKTVTNPDGTKTTTTTTTTDGNMDENFEFPNFDIPFLREKFRTMSSIPWPHQKASATPKGVSKLSRLQKLKDSGVISYDEYEKLKKAILDEEKLL